VDYPATANIAQRLRFLLRYAILAPSGHNTQPWKFAVERDVVYFVVDRSCWLKYADPDERELHISIGCALENFLVAAQHFNFDCEVDYFPKEGDWELAARVRCSSPGTPSTFRPPELFEKIVSRHTNRQAFKSRRIPEVERRRLTECVVEKNVTVDLTDNLRIKRRVDELMGEADARQFANPYWRAELGRWIGRGSFGNSWLMAKIGQMAVTFLNMGKGTARQDSELLQSAPLLGIMSAPDNTRITQLQVGQAFERLSLTAASLGIAVHSMSQVLEIQDIKNQVQELLPNPRLLPQHTFRLGYADPELERTPRRPLEEVMIK
jgi:nitroreductase